MEGLKLNNNCRHNARSRYTSGFFCEDCNTFFANNSSTYRSGELLSSIWMVLHNINATRYQNGKEIIQEVKEMKDKIGIGIKHENYEELISEAEKIMDKYNKNSESASMILK